MFDILNFYQGKVLCGVIVWLIICAIQCHEANKEIEKINDANSSDFRKQRLQTAPFGGIVITIIVLIILLLLPIMPNE